MVKHANPEQVAGLFESPRNLHILGTWSGRQVEQELGGAARAIEKLTAEKVLRTGGRYLKIKPEELARRRTPFRDYRAMAMELIYRYSRMVRGSLRGVSERSVRG